MAVKYYILPQFSDSLVDCTVFYLLLLCSFSFLPQSNVAQETLNQVQGIETAMNSSEHIRQQVVSLQQETDGMVADINNITQTVRKKNHNSARRYCRLLGNFGA